MVFLALVVFAVQLLFGLYAASAVTTAAYDAARIVAGSGEDATGGASTADIPRAEAHARQVLGRYGRRVRFEWQVDDDVVRLRVTAQNPNFLPRALGGTLGFDRIDRTVTVRVEQLR